jgi:hypothetical protein
MQVQRNNDPWNQPGDWMDVVLASGRFRQRFLHYTGTVIVHCHWLTHEDHGCIGEFTIKDCPLDKPPMIVGMCSKDETDCDLRGEGTSECARERDPCGGDGNGVHSENTVPNYSGAHAGDEVTTWQCLDGLWRCTALVEKPYFMCGAFCGHCANGWYLSGRTTLAIALASLAILSLFVAYMVIRHCRDTQKQQPVKLDDGGESQPLRHGEQQGARRTGDSETRSYEPMAGAASGDEKNKSEPTSFLGRVAGLHTAAKIGIGVAVVLIIFLIVATLGNSEPAVPQPEAQQEATTSEITEARIEPELDCGNHATAVSGECRCVDGFINDAEAVRLQQEKRSNPDDFNCTDTGFGYAYTSLPTALLACRSCGDHGTYVPGDPPTCVCQDTGDPANNYEGMFCEYPPALRVSGAVDSNGDELEINGYSVNGDYDRHESVRCNGKPVYEHAGTFGTSFDGNVIYQPADQPLYWQISSGQDAREYSGSPRCDRNYEGNLKYTTPAFVLCGTPLATALQIGHNRNGFWRFTEPDPATESYWLGSTTACYREHQRSGEANIIVVAEAESQNGIGF